MYLLFYLFYTNCLFSAYCVFLIFASLFNIHINFYAVSQYDALVVFSNLLCTRNFSLTITFKVVMLHEVVLCERG